MSRNHHIVNVRHHVRRLPRSRKHTDVRRHDRRIVGGLVSFSYKGGQFVVPRDRAQNPRVQRLLNRSSIMDLNEFFPAQVPKTRPSHRLPPIRHIRAAPRMEAVAKRPAHARTFRPLRKSAERVKLTGVDIENLKRIADRYSVDRDLIDWKAHVDSSIGFEANKEHIREDIIKPLAMPEKIAQAEPVDMRAIDFERENYFDSVRERAEEGDEEAKRALRDYGLKEGNRR